MFYGRKISVKVCEKISVKVCEGAAPFWIQEEKKKSLIVLLFCVQIIPTDHVQVTVLKAVAIPIMVKS